MGRRVTQGRPARSDRTEEPDPWVHSSAVVGLAIRVASAHVGSGNLTMTTPSPSLGLVEACRPRQRTTTLSHRRNRRILRPRPGLADQSFFNTPYRLIVMRLLKGLCGLYGFSRTGIPQIDRSPSRKPIKEPTLAQPNGIGHAGPSDSRPERKRRLLVWPKLNRPRVACAGPQSYGSPEQRGEEGKLTTHQPDKPTRRPADQPNRLPTALEGGTGLFWAIRPRARAGTARNRPRASARRQGNTTAHNGRSLRRRVR